jgi:hypothetical protein
MQEDSEYNLPRESYTPWRHDQAIAENALSRQRRGARASKSKRVPLPFDVGREGRAAAHHHGHERAERILTESEVHSMIALTTNKRDRVPS